MKSQSILANRLPSKSTKRCSRCEEELKITFFYGDQRSPDGYATVCRKCSYARRKTGTGSFKIRQDQITENIPCEGCKWNDHCKKRHMSCPNYRQWVLTGKTNELPQHPDSYDY